MIKTPAIVIWTLKYGDSSLIANCYTKKDGLKGYILNGILKSKKTGIKKALFQPFNLINIISDHKKKGLNHIKEVELNKPLNSIHSSITKTTIALFLSEILKNVLQEEGGENENLYNFLEIMTIWLDNNDSNSNFHIKFLIELTRYIGFYPNKSNSNYKYFDMLSGCFTNDNNNSNTLLTGNVLKSFKEVLGMNFDQIKLLKWNSNVRNSLLNEIIRYYSLHLQGFKTPNSLSVLHEIFK